MKHLNRYLYWYLSKEMLLCLSFELLSEVRQYLGEPCESMASARIGMETLSLLFFNSLGKTGLITCRKYSGDVQEMSRKCLLFKGCSYHSNRSGNVHYF